MRVSKHILSLNDCDRNLCALLFRIVITKNELSTKRKTVQAVCGCIPRWKGGDQRPLSY